MKKTYLFCTKIWFYLCEIPPIILLAVSIIYNGDSEGLLKLYPLIAFSIAAIIFVFLYFFRMIIISTEEIKCIGAFSSKDSALITKDTALIFTQSRANKLTVRLYGQSLAPAFSWSSKEGTANMRIDLFREKVIGGKRAIKRVLSYFEVPKDDVLALLSQNEYDKEFENYIVRKNVVDDKETVSIEFTRTI